MEIAITVFQIIILSLLLIVGIFHSFIPYLINSTTWTTRLLFCPLSRYLFRPALINYLERSLLDGNYDLCFPSDSLVIIKLYGSNEEFCFGLGLEKLKKLVSQNQKEITVFLVSYLTVSGKPVPRH